jgi:DNA-binding NtrC family response regulator
LEYLTGLEVLEEVKRSCQGKTQVIYLSAQEHVHVAIKALKEGAITYVEKGVNAVEAINDAIEQIIELTNDFKIQLDVSKFRRAEF